MAYKKGLKQTDVSVKGASLSEAMQRIEVLQMLTVVLFGQIYVVKAILVLFGLYCR